MAITVENLTKYYGVQKAVDNVSFTINTGEVVGFLGPNGAGKSTTMRMITCYLEPSSGEIRLDNFSASQQPQEIKKRIGYLPENNPLYLDMPIVDYLRFCAELQGVPKAEISGRIRKMIDVVGLKLERYKKIGELSKGYRQRVGLAQALIHNPEVLILDEPTTGLDPNQIIEIRQLIRELGKDKTVILSSHILPEVEATCDRILIINKGKIVADGTAEQLRSQAQGSELLTIRIEGDTNSEILAALQNLETIEKIKEVPNEEGKFLVTSKKDTSSRKDIFKLCVEKNWYLLEMHGTETSLEDIFRQLTKN
ncbi:MAG: ATP-binding cassette domain-containing protein [Cytophagales bacterium]|nr:ATP-binding cassette domain-containing protein [Cytophagales bacterium]MDW8383221.1 ATP-binding cassette domain-containing protein [Flammeovirgaceae bacterium]